jgi:hypothetical protein
MIVRLRSIDSKMFLVQWSLQLQLIIITRMSISHRITKGIQRYQKESNELTLVEKYGPYTVDYDKDTSVKWIKTLHNNMVSNTAV